jgi:hypothetical protein
MLTFDVILNTEINRVQQFTIKAFLLGLDIPMDIILGRDTIKEHSLVLLYPSQF